MTEPVPTVEAGSTAAASTAIAADSGLPRVAVSRSFIFLYALAYTGVWLALLTPMLVTIALRVQQLAPHDAANQLVRILGIGAVFAMVGNPVFGWLSDRTRSRHGMRRPWLIGGMLVGTLSLAVIALAPNIAVALLGWCLAQLAFNAVLAATVAILPDQVPVSQRGTVAGVLGICLPLGQVAGTFLVQALPNSMLLMFVVPAVIGTAAVLLLALVLRDRRLISSHDPATASFASFLRSFWLVPGHHPNFFWAWLSRFLLVTGTAFLTTYQSYYLMDKLGYPVEAVPGLIYKGVLVQAAMIIISSLASGKASDASGRRKVFVFVAAVVYGTGLWIIALTDAYSGFLLGMAFTGVGQGVFFAVELALVTQILPDRERNAARDLGVFNIANTLPQSLILIWGPLVLWAGGGSYMWLFVVAGCSAFLSALAIVPLRGVR